MELKDRAGCGPLHYAAGKGWATAVKLLVGHGASTQARDLKGDTPLHWAASNRGPGPNSEWDGGDDDERERPDHTETIRLLVKLGQGIDAVNEEGWTPLHRAAYNGRVATIQTLCEMGASVNAANQAGVRRGRVVLGLGGPRGGRERDMCAGVRRIRRCIWRRCRGKLTRLRP